MPQLLLTPTETGTSIDVYLLLPTQVGVMDHFKTYVKYPPRYKAASFTIDQEAIIEQMTPKGH